MSSLFAFNQHRHEHVRMKDKQNAMEFCMTMFVIDKLFNYCE